MLRASAGAMNRAPTYSPDRLGFLQEAQLTADCTSRDSRILLAILFGKSRNLRRSPFLPVMPQP